MTSLPSPPVLLKGPDRYQRIEQLRQHFWQRWRNEYLAELQQRSKWRLKQTEPRIGDMVVFKESNTPPLKWRLGRVLQLYPGTDGVCRVADFTTQRGVVRRALNRVCLLPRSEEESESCSFQGGQDVNAPQRGNRFSISNRFLGDGRLEAGRGDPETASSSEQ